MKILYRNIFIALGAVFILFLLWYFRSIVAYVVIAGVISLIGSPLVGFLSGIKYKKIKIPRFVSALITLVVIWGFVVLFFRIFVPLLASEANEISKIDVHSITENLEEPLKKAENILRNYQLNNNSKEKIQESIAKKIISILNLSNLGNLFGYIAGMLGDIFIAFFSISFLAFFFLKEKSLLPTAILSFIPQDIEERVKHVLISIKNLLTRYFIGVCIQISLIIFLVTIGLVFIAGLTISKALIIALIIGLMNIIPYLGPILGIIFGVVLGIATNLNIDYYQEMLPLIGIMLIVFVTVQVIDNVLFQPLIYSKSVKAHPIEIFLVIMMAGSIAGIAGMILAIPTYTILRVIAKEFLNNFKFVKNLTKNI